MDRRTLLAATGALALAVAAGAAGAVEPSQYSEAERMLFAQDHLRSLGNAAHLEYAFRKSGRMEPEATDRATVSVGAPTAEEGRSVKVVFLSVGRRLDLPAVQDAKGNPIILYFLEHDVREMKRLTGGSVYYFRKRIRMALAEAAQVRPVSATVGGRKVAATQIRIAPYRDDPMRARYERFAEKTYVLTLSEQVPGGVVELRSELLAPEDGGPREVEIAESLTFEARR
jgi:hypothetical protein